MNTALVRVHHTDREGKQEPERDNHGENDHGRHDGSDVEEMVPISKSTGRHDSRVDSH